MAFYPGQSVQIIQSFQDRAFTVRANEIGQVRNIDQRTGNMQIDFGSSRIVTFLSHEFQAWLRPVVVQQPMHASPVKSAYAPPAQPAYSAPAQPAYAPPAQPAYAPPAQPAYAPPANQNPMYVNQSQPAYVQKPAYIAPPQQPAYSAPPQQPAYAAQPVASATSWNPPKAAYQAPTQPVYQPPKPQLYQVPKYAPQPVNPEIIAARAVNEYKMDQERKKEELSLPMTGTLIVRVGGCKKLPGVDTFGGCDPYVKVKYDVKTERTRKKNSKNPEFNETFEFPIESEKYLVVEVWDYNAVGSDELIYTLPIPLHGMLQYGFKQRHEFALSEKSRISIDLTYTPYEQSTFKERQDVVVQFWQKPFGIQFIPGPNGRGAKIIGFGNNVAPNAGVKENMYITMINGVTVVGVWNKVVKKLLEKAKKNSVLNFADLRVGVNDNGAELVTI